MICKRIVCKIVFLNELEFVCIQFNRYKYDLKVNRL